MLAVIVLRQMGMKVTLAIAAFILNVGAVRADAADSSCVASLNEAGAADWMRGKVGGILPKGIVFVDSPLKLTARDSGRRFVGAPDGSTVLSAGIPVKGWNVKSPGVWRANAPEMPGKPQCFESLFVNGRRAVRALHPDSESFHPGEWLYDGTAGEVLYRPLPDETIDAIEAIAPRAGFATLVEAVGANDVVFENITFAHTAPTVGEGPSTGGSSQGAKCAPSAVVVDGTTNLVFRNCTFAHTGGYAVWFRSKCVSNAIEKCNFADLGGGGVKIGPFDERTKRGVDCARVEKPAETRFCRVVDSTLRAGGRFHEADNAISIAHASDCLVRGNVIEDFHSTGISCGYAMGYSGSVAQRNLVQKNRISRIGQNVLSDVAGIRLCGASFGSRVDGNVIEDVKGRCDDGWGICFDEGCEGAVAEGNVVSDCNGGTFHQHFGRDNVLRNNIFRNPRYGKLLVVTRAEPHRSLLVEGNRFCWQRGDALASPRRGLLGGAKVEWKDNIWSCAEGNGRFWGMTGEAWRASGFRFDHTAEIQRLVDSAAVSGGEAVVGPGDFAITQIRLKSNVTLRLRNGTHLVGDKDVTRAPSGVMDGLSDAKGRYPRWNRALIRVWGVTNVAVVGEGADVWIDGQDAADPDGEEGYRGIHGLHLDFCTNVFLRGYEVRNCGNYAHLIDDSAHVTLSGVKVRGGHDGADFHFSDHVRVTDCDFRTGDDCVAGYGNCDVIVSNCLLNTACSPVRFGGADVLFTDCRAWGPAEYPHRWTLTDDEKAKGVPESHVGGRRNMGCFYQFCTTSKRAFPVPPRNMVFRNFRIANAGRFICTLTGQARIWSSGPSIPELVFENVVATGLERPGAICPADDSPMRVKLRACSFAFKDRVDAAFVGANVTFDAKEVRLANAGKLAEVYQDKDRVRVPEHPSWRVEPEGSLEKLMK